ncbi:MAG: serine hydroxymethyltransferase [Streptococcaceae bacterium]|jgi:glycine hydroxymethyltransferase|nr:serine hydroxymethyltransferase [Streptococcaceae bacterium]
MAYFENHDFDSKDPDLWSAIHAEEARQNHNIELIASENVVSEQVLAAQGSALTNKYAEGYPGRRYYGGTECVDVVETLAIERAKQLFGAEFVNVQPHSGSQANMAAYIALVNPGDTILAMDLNAGGHLTHGAKVSFSGKTYNFVPYGLNPETELLDFEEIARLAEENQPKLIVAGASAYSRVIDFGKFRAIADSVGAKLMVDMAHIAGLVATSLHPNPVGVADVVTTTTHKTLRGPRGGMILTNDAELAKKINSAIFPGIQGGPLEHVIAGKAAAFGEALKPEFKTYIEKVLANTAAMADEFMKLGYHVISGGTDNHMFNVSVLEHGVNGKEAEGLLDSVSITVNKESLPKDTLPPTKTSGIRIGAAAVTSRGFDEAASRDVVHLIDRAFAAKGDSKQLETVKKDVWALTEKYPLYH